MAQSALNIDIRPRESDQIATEVEVHNAAMPPDAHITEDEVRRNDELHTPDEPPLQVLAWLDGQAVASGYSGRNIFTPSGRFRITVRVRPEFRRKGIARTLYEQLTAYARKRGAAAFTCVVHEHNLPALEAWLAREGYRETERMRPSELNLEEFEFGRWQGARERVEQQEIVLTTLAEEDTEENRRKLWELECLTSHDVPHDVTEDQPFDVFNDLLSRPEALRDCLVIARDGDRYVGLSLLVHMTDGKALTGMTGVHRDYRNRGIALAMKVRSAELARDRGYTRMITNNHVNNPAMLSVNDRLGYRALPVTIRYVKTLGDDGASG